MIELGCTATDRVTKFRGVVTGKAQYLTGCNQALLMPSVDADGKLRDGGWFDEQRLEVDEEQAVIVTDNSKGNGCDLAPPIR